MSEKELDERVTELQNDSVELYSFVAENVSEDLSDDEMDALVSDLESDTLSLRDFVIKAMED
ncbi:hypothetical protein ACOMCU_16195 [Lysinibacillus sp. UGB7]|uniref:hypothetical protein n=1 Tax=Lysinibacillus sp. UGB7 TaxID=3411039 RepID=UPI003B77ABE6